LGKQVSGGNLSVRERVFMEYTHSSPEEEVTCFAGSYYVEAEKILSYKGRQVLYLIENTTPLTSCSQGSCLLVGGMSFISVPGFVKTWQGRITEAGLVSEVEQVLDEEAKAEIKRALTLEHGVANIDFW